MGHIRPLPPHKLPLRRIPVWGNDIHEWTVFIPIPQGKQYVLSISHQRYGWCTMELVLIDFISAVRPLWTEHFMSHHRY